MTLVTSKVPTIGLVEVPALGLGYKRLKCTELCSKIK